MKRVALLFLIIFSAASFCGIKEDFLAGRYEPIIKIPLEKLKTCDDKFYAGCAYLNYEPVKSWERGFYLISSSSAGDAAFLAVLNKELEHLKKDPMKLSRLFIFSVYSQMYGTILGLLYPDYASYCYDGNADQWRDTCELLRKSFKTNTMHPSVCAGTFKDGRIIFKEKNTVFEISGDSVKSILLNGEEIFYALYRDIGYLPGNIALKYGIFEKRPVEIAASDIGRAYKYTVYFGKIKAGTTYTYLKDEGDHYTLYVHTKTAPFFDLMFKMRDYVSVKLRKGDFATLYLYENLSEGSYKAVRWTEFFPEEYYALYKGKERVSLPVYAQDNYSLIYLIKNMLPVKYGKINVISRKKVFPFELVYESGDQKGGDRMLTISLKYTGQFELKNKFSFELLFNETKKETVYSRSQTEYGSLTSQFDGAVSEKEWMKEIGSYENFRD